MTTKFFCLAAVTSIAGAITVFAENPTGKTGEGTLTIEKKNYTFTHAVAFETAIDSVGHPVVAVKAR